MEWEAHTEETDRVNSAPPALVIEQRLLSARGACCGSCGRWGSRGRGGTADYDWSASSQAGCVIGRGERECVWERSRRQITGRRVVCL
jgi:hypothetical protein